MKVLSYIAVAAAVAALGAGAQAAPQFPKGAAALEAQLLATQTADTKSFIKDEAIVEANSRFLSADTSRAAARKNGAAGSDVSKLAFLILMEADRVADSNVSQLVSGVQADAASRQDIRQQAAQANGIAGAQQSQFSAGSQTANKQQGKAFMPLISSDNSGGDPLRNAIDKARSPSEVPPTTMNLQDAMDRQSQIEDLLSKAMARVNEPG